MTLLIHMESKKKKKKKDTNELFTKQKQIHRHRKQTYGSQRGRRRGEINQKLENKIHTLLKYIDKR